MTFEEKAIKVHGNRYIYRNVEYINAKTNVEIICRKHGSFLQKPSNHLNGSGCQQCGKISIEKKKRGNKNMFVKVSTKVHKGEYDYTDSIYKGNDKKLKIRCKIHGYFWQTPSNHKKGKGCPKCKGRKISNKKRKHTTQSYIKDVKVIYGDKFNYDKVVYTGTNQKITVTCNKHGEFEVYAGRFLNKKCGCPKCSREEAPKTKIKNAGKVFERKAISLYGDRFTYEKVEYRGVKELITITCKKHGDFDTIPNNFLSGRGCPKCNSAVSTGEGELAEYLKSKISIKSRDRSVIKPYEIDILVPSKKVGIEYNGVYYHSDVFLEADYHKDKLNLCREKGYRLIQVFEDEWLFNKDIVKSRLDNILGVTGTKVYARKCEVREVPTPTAMKFLEDNHLQGKVGGTHKIGLYQNNELISLMTFGGYRQSLGRKHQEGEYELIRFCNKINTSVIGGASKLFNHFLKNYEPSTIISYADLRWSEGNLYEKLGFIKEAETKPNYFYSKASKRENRYKYRKQVLVSEGFDKNKTEKQIMEERGFKRVYDCGAARYKYKVNK